MKLNLYKNNIVSQFGEDGVIEKIFKVIAPGKGPFCVEFGAWDGKHFSNTYNLIKNKGWRAVLIEPNKARFAELLQTYAGNDKVVCINKFVRFKGKDSLDKLLAKTPIPREFELLSIDIDGNDYHIWESLKTYKPKVVVIEFNPTIQHTIEFIQPKDFSVTQGCSLLSLVKLAKRKKYELIAATDSNAFFVTRNLYPRFRIKDNSPEVLHDNSKYTTNIFQLYDGTLVLSGRKDLMWHGIKFHDEAIQVLPKFLRKFPDKYNMVLTRLYRRDMGGLVNLWKLYASRQK